MKLHDAGFIAAASLTQPANTVCLQIHGMTFIRPVQRGEIACFYSRVVYSGKSKLVSNVRMEANSKPVVEGFITFIHVDDQGKATPHGIVIQPKTDEERKLNEQAKNLFIH